MIVTSFIILNQWGALIENPKKLYHIIFFYFQIKIDNS